MSYLALYKLKAEKKTSNFVCVCFKGNFLPRNTVTRKEIYEDHIFDERIPLPTFSLTYDRKTIEKSLSFV